MCLFCCSQYISDIAASTFLLTTNQVHSYYSKFTWQANLTKKHLGGPSKMSSFLYVESGTSSLSDFVMKKCNSMQFKIFVTFLNLVFERWFSPHQCDSSSVTRAHCGPHGSWYRILNIIKTHKIFFSHFTQGGQRSFHELECLHSGLLKVVVCIRFLFSRFIIIQALILNNSD